MQRQEKKEMLALSFKQPWAFLVAAGIKDVDNRTWWLHMPPFLNYPADPRRIYIHASKTRVASKEYTEAFEQLKRFVKDESEAWRRWFQFWQFLARHPLGAIIGEVDITACFSADQVGYRYIKSPWFTGPYGLVLKNAILYDKPIPYKGKLGFFEVDLSKRGS
jgi:hypothetical protein